MNKQFTRMTLTAVETYTLFIHIITMSVITTCRLYKDVFVILHGYSIVACAPWLQVQCTYYYCGKSRANNSVRMYLTNARVFSV